MRQRGFTLLELMLVVVILAIMAGLIGLAVGGNPHTALEREAKRLTLLLEFAREEAMQRGLQLGFFSDGERYTLLVYSAEDAEWVPIEGARFSQHLLPDAIELESMDTETVNPGALAATGDKPSIVLLSSGELTPFELAFRHRELPNDSYIVSSDGLSGIYSRHAD